LLHRSTDLRQVDVARRRGIPVTNPIRTVGDLGAVAPKLVPTAIERGLYLDRFSVDALQRLVEDLSRPGRRGLGVLRRALQRRALGGVKSYSPLESTFAAIAETVGVRVAPRREPPPQSLKIFRATGPKDLQRRQSVSGRPATVHPMAPASDVEVVEAAGHEVRITSPHKVFFPERGETKLDLVRYYLAIEDPLMRAMGGRPVLMQRFPEGAGGPNFFQKRVPKDIPDWLQTTTVSTVNGTPSQALVAADVAHVAWAVNLTCLGFHVWPNLAADPDHADELRLDLDPQPGTGFAEAAQAAVEVKALLDEAGIAAFPKTTGNRGIHVYARLQPRWDSYQVRAAAVAVARELERRRPDLITAAWWKEERGERIFIDYNQNAPHKTVFGAWSVRARVGGQVSTPLSWDELGDVHPDDLTLSTVPARVAERGDPWSTLGDNPQSIEPLLAMSERDMANGLMDAPWPPVYPKMPNEPPRVAPSRAAKET
jgi:DNA ligase D-like protein (predicted polymerase)